MEACLGFKMGLSLASVIVLLRVGTLILEPFGDFAAQNTLPSAFETGGVDCLDSLACVAAKKEKESKRRSVGADLAQSLRNSRFCLLGCFQRKGYIWIHAGVHLNKALSPLRAHLPAAGCNGLRQLRCIA